MEFILRKLSEIIVKVICKKPAMTAFVYDSNNKFVKIIH